jgi:hypothetical protein
MRICFRPPTTASPLSAQRPFHLAIEPRSKNCRSAPLIVSEKQISQNGTGIQLSHASLFSDLSNVTLRRVFNTDQGWIMEAHGQNSAVCPGCQSISRSRHSRYWRSLKDLPVQGTQVMLRLHLGRWRCRNAGCQRRIFTERLPKVCAPYAQQTKRSSEIIAAMGHALGGRP